MPTQDAEFFRLKEVAIDYVQRRAKADRAEVKVRLFLEPIEEPVEQKE